MEQNNTVYTTGVIILIIIIIAGISYSVYSLFIKDDNTNFNTEELDNIGLELFDMVDNRQGYDLPFFDTENKLTYDSIIDTEKLVLAHKLIPDSEKTINEECTNALSNCAFETISVTTMEKYYHELFGSDKTVNHQFYTIYNNHLTCSYRTDEYECTVRLGINEASVIQYIKYDSTKEVDGDIIITVKNLYVIDDVGIYSDSTESNRIDNLEYYDDQMSSLSENDYNNGINGINNSNYNNFINNLFAKYNISAGIYKVTFKKDANDNYYWYSSEIVK